MRSIDVKGEIKDIRKVPKNSAFFLLCRNEMDNAKRILLVLGNKSGVFFRYSDQ